MLKGCFINETKTKINPAFLLVGLVPVLVIELLSYNTASSSIEEEVFASMGMYSTIKNDALQNYFSDRAADGRVLASSCDVYQSLNVLQSVDSDLASPE